jgi:hypothetical protein
MKMKWRGTERKQQLSLIELLSQHLPGKFRENLSRDSHDPEGD